MKKLDILHAMKLKVVKNRKCTLCGKVNKKDKMCFSCYAAFYAPTVQSVYIARMVSDEEIGYNPLMATKKILKDISTERDNLTFDASKIIWIASCLSYISFTIISAIKGTQYSPIEFGTGLAAVLGGGGIAVRLNSDKQDKK